MVCTSDFCTACICPVVMGSDDGDEDGKWSCDEARGTVKDLESTTVGIGRDERLTGRCGSVVVVHVAGSKG